MSNRNNLKEWQNLETHYNDLRDTHIRDYFKNDADRFDGFNIHIDGCLFDFSKHKITHDTLGKFETLAEALDFSKQRDAMFDGQAINISENRAVLHVALRGSCSNDLVVNGETVNDYVRDTLLHMHALSDEIRNNPNITDVVNIGIGGSDLGPRMAYKALRPSADGPNIYFISNIDASGLDQRLQKLNPENTVFIISTKMFRTQETIANAQSAKDWLARTIATKDLPNHLIAVTQNEEAALNFGVPLKHILQLREWIGGRYSIWSGVGLSIAIANGFGAFKDMLRGARDVDRHFRDAPFHENIPVLMAMLGVWHRNLGNAQAHAVLPYSHDLRELPIYMQQLDMESNGKNVSIDGDAINHKSGAVVFGEAGTNAQHTFMQLLHQGSDIVPCDFIAFKHAGHDYDAHHKNLLANALAQAHTLMQGAPNKGEPHRNFDGDRPNSMMIFDRLDAYHLGMLLALYEHKVFVQGIIWGINSFDQWGVELGKLNADGILKAMNTNETNTHFDSSTSGLIKYLI